MKPIKLTSERDLLAAAFRTAELRYRILGMSLKISKMDDQCNGQDGWKEFRETLAPNDKIWPFHFNKNTLSMRKGFLIVRDGKPLKALVTELS